MTDVAEPRPGGAATGVALSVIVPACNEEAAIPEFVARLRPVLAGLGLEYEVVFVDDGSTDRTWRVIADCRREDPRMRALRLSRNFGKEIAMTAGLDSARGDAVVFIDADLQDPPELIAEFVALWQGGYQNVYGLRVRRDRDSAGKRLMAGLFYRAFNLLADVRLPAHAGDFRLIGPDVVRAVRACRDRQRLMKGLFAWAGYPSVAVPYERPQRAAGRTKFGPLRLVGLAFDGIAAHSVAPLRAWTWVGLGCVGAAVLLGLWVLLESLFAPEQGVPRGLYITLLVVLGFSSLHFIMLGVLGEYVGRIYNEVKDRPLYLLRGEDDDGDGPPAGADRPARRSGTTWNVKPTNG